MKTPTSPKLDSLRGGPVVTEVGWPLQSNFGVRVQPAAQISAIGGLSDLGSSLNLQHLTKQIRGLPQGSITPQSQPKTLDRHAHRCRPAGVQVPARSHDTTLRPAQFSRVAPWPAIMPTIPGPRQSLFVEY